jgi:acyl carrier protein
VNESQIREAVFRILRQIAPEADLEKCDEGANLRQALDIDSFDFLKLIVAVNDQLKVEIPESDYERAATLNGLIGYLAARLR